ncbi:hypothetical protein DOT_4171, partial [Desulfosporosinus sp. OT]
KGEKINELVVEKVQPYSTIGTTATEDLFDEFGVLLLGKGQQITNSIKELLEKREVFVWANREDKDCKSEELEGGIWRI